MTPGLSVTWSGDFDALADTISAVPAVYRSNADRRWNAASVFCSVRGSTIQRRSTGDSNSDSAGHSGTTPRDQTVREFNTTFAVVTKHAEPNRYRRTRSGDCTAPAPSAGRSYSGCGNPSAATYVFIAFASCASVARRSVTPSDKRVRSRERDGTETRGVYKAGNWLC